MSHKVLIGGTAREVTGGRVLIGGTGREMASGKVLVGGTAYNISFATPKKASTYAVGSSVFLYEAGTAIEYLVVHQGLPSSMYDSSCNGTWLLRKGIYQMSTGNTTDNRYDKSPIHTSLNSTFLGLFSSGTQSAIKQAKIPYSYYIGLGGAIYSGANGLSAKVFLLSAREVNHFGFGTVEDSSVLDYFNISIPLYGEVPERVAHFDGEAVFWWLRSPMQNTSYEAHVISNIGRNEYGHLGEQELGIRPALILNSSTEFDADTNIILT